MSIPVNPAPVNPPANPPVNPGPPVNPAPAIPVVTIPARSIQCKVCSKKTNQAAAIGSSWIEVKEVDATGMLIDDYYLCADCQSKVDFLGNGGQSA